MVFLEESLGMTHWLTNSIGLAAGFLTTICLFPQLHSIWRRKSARDVSLTMFLIMAIGVVLWLTYGIVIRSLPLIAADGTSLVAIIAILYFKIRYDRRQ
jgi:MtN3 and saliva related transmembrane protein